MSVSLSPSNSLGFNRPLTQLVKRSLTISNPNAQPVAFKVKTTAPKLYCVRPNSGRIEPGEAVEIAVMLQAMKEEPPLSTKCRDKFLIQSTFITPEKRMMSLQDIWASVDSADDSQVSQQKLKVVYLPPEGQIIEEDEEAAMMEPSESRYDTVRQSASMNGHPTEPIPDFDSQPLQLPVTTLEPEKIIPRQPEPPIEEEPRATTPSVDFNVAHEEEEELDSGVVSDAHVNVHTPPSPHQPVEELPSEPHLDPEVIMTKYEAALAEIERLRNLLAAAARPPSTELRRRVRPQSDNGSTMGETDVGTMMEEPPQMDGVPLQLVVIIALGVFITTYLFF